MSNLVRTKAIVLRRTNYGEADRIVQLLTPDQGKISVMAKGVRREKSKLAGGIELFAVCDVTVSRGKKDLSILTGARLVKFYRHIIDDYERLQAGYEVIKQVAKAAETIDEPAFFTLLEQSFESLDNHEIDTKVVMSWFWIQLSILLGTGINLSTDVDGKKLVEDVQYEFSELDSGFRAQKNGRFTADHIKLLRILSAQPPKVAMQIKDISRLIDDCLWVAERAIHH